MPTEPTLSDVIAALEKTLAAEKAALLSGAYGVVVATTSEKERLANLLDTMLADEARSAQLPAYRKRIRKILEAAKETETLLHAARMGAASARSRIMDILTRQRMVGVYAESGDKVLAPGAGVTRQKFA